MKQYHGPAVIVWAKGWDKIDLQAGEHIAIEASGWVTIERDGEVLAFPPQAFKMIRVATIS